MFFPRPTNLRSTVELAIIMLLAALFLETWPIKGIVVPCRVAGGSMAETLLGGHRSVTCVDCGFRFACGTDQAPLPPRATCPNCGYVENDLRSLPDVEGERLLIDRAAFQFRPPRRWEVAAIRPPVRADSIAVKRIVGLPGEVIEICDGDVYADGRIQRKDLEQQRAMAVPVHAADCRPTIEPVPPPRWRTENPDSRWNWTGGRFAHPRTPANEPIDWLVYHHGRRLANGFTESPVADLSGYNQSRPRREEDVRAVADLMLSVRLIRESGRGAFHVRATDGVERFEARLRFDDDRLLYEVLRGGVPLPGAPLLDDIRKVVGWVERSEPHQISVFCGGARCARPTLQCCFPVFSDSLLVEVSLIDRQFLLAIDGRTVAHVPFERAGRTSEAVSTPLAIGVRELGISVDELQVFRDVFYTAPVGLPPRGPVRLGMDEYYVLGDNSPISEDSRIWPDGGAVPGNLLVGKPLWAVPPVNCVPFHRWRFSVPNPARIRYIH